MFFCLSVHECFSESFHADPIKSDLITLRSDVFVSFGRSEGVERMGTVTCNCNSHPLDGTVSLFWLLWEGAPLRYLAGASVSFGRQSGLPVNPNGFSKGIAKLGQTR